MSDIEEPLIDAIVDYAKAYEHAAGGTAARLWQTITDRLAEHDAEVWESGNNQGFDDAWNISSGTYSKRVPNPYRS